MATKPLVLGIGNTLVGDDGIGPLVVEALRESLGAAYAFATTPTAGLDLLDMLGPFERVVIVDAVHAPAEPVGSVRVFHWQTDDVDAPSYRSHALGLLDTLVLAQRLDLPRPASVLILAIAIHDITTFGEQLSPGLWERLPGIVASVGEHILQSCAAV